MTAMLLYSPRMSQKQNLPFTCSFLKFSTFDESAFEKHTALHCCHKLFNNHSVHQGDHNTSGTQEMPEQKAGRSVYNTQPL